MARGRRCGRPCAIAALLVLAALPAEARDGPDPGWEKVRIREVVGGKTGIADFAVAPDGSFWFVEVYKGNVWRHDPATNKTTKQFRVEVLADPDEDERGLVGFALDPDFEDNGVFYLYYTRTHPAHPDGVNRISKVVNGTERILLDDIPAAPHHNGGRMVFDGRKHLYVGIGENYLYDVAQDPRSPLGKVLRMTRDGKPVEGNYEGLVYTLGHRNIYGMAVDPDTGDVWITENGNWHRDEINRLKPGGNYGYPVCEGFSKFDSDEPCPPEYEPPLVEVYHTKTAAPTGAAFYKGQFYWLSWNEGAIHHVWRDPGNKTWRNERVLDPDGHRFPDLETSPDGKELYYSSWTTIWHLDFPAPKPPKGNGTGNGTGDGGLGGGGSGTKGNGSKGNGTLGNETRGNGTGGQQGGSTPPPPGPPPLPPPDGRTPGAQPVDRATPGPGLLLAAAALLVAPLLLALGMARRR